MEQANNSKSLKNLKSIEIMLALLFLVAPFYYFPNIGGGGMRIPDNITSWMVAISIISYSSFKVNQSESFILPKNFYILILAPIVLTVSGFMAGVEQPVDWLFRMITVWGGVLFFCSILQHQITKTGIDKVLFLILLSALLQGSLGFAQIYFQEDWPRTVLPQAILPEGMFQQINNQATYQVTAIFIGFYLLTSKSLIKAKNILPITFLVLVTLQSSALIGFSGSRIGWLGLLVGLVFVFISVFGASNTINKKKFGLLLASLLLGLSFGVVMSNGRIIDKTEAMTSGYSGDARIGIYSLAIDLVKEEPIFGHGIGSFTKVWQNGKPAFYKKHPDATLPNSTVTHPHNEFLLWLVEGGLVALFGLTVLLFVILMSLLKQPKETRYLLLALLLPIALHTQVEVPFYVSTLHYFLFLFLLTLIYHKQTQTLSVRLSVMAKQSLYGVIILVFLAGQFFLVHSIKANRNLVSYYLDMKPENRHFLEYPLANPFFSPVAIWLLMRESLYTAIQNNDEASVQNNIDWTKQELLDKPNVELFVRLINAYTYLGQKEKACNYLNLGLAMFPSDKQLISFISQCKSDQ